MNETPYFSIKNIRKTWEDDSFQLNFNAEIHKGSLLGLVGRSGSGKSTVLRIAAGLICTEEYVKNHVQKKKRGVQKETDAEKTRIILDGKDITCKPPSERGIGMVFQNHALFPHLTVLDNVAFGLRFSHRAERLKKTDAREKAYEFLGLFEMQNFASRFPETLSGGEAQRVSLARTLIVEPKAILFDEPFSSLDRPMTQKLLNDIKEMKERTKFTGIFVTHDIQDAKAMCENITAMKEGSQIWTGSAGLFDEEILRL